MASDIEPINPDHTALEAMVGQTLTPLSNELEPLVHVALRGLPQMHDERTGLFSHKAVLDPAGRLVNSGHNRLYTGACTIGLLSCANGPAEPVRAQATQSLEAVVGAADERYPAVLAAALWSCVLAGRGEAADLAAKIVAITE